MGGERERERALLMLVTREGFGLSRVTEPV